MAFEFRLPDIGEGLAEAEVTEWLVEVGQEVQLDQPLVQIETDKAVTDIPAPRAGVLLHQGAAAGTVVRVGEVLAVIGETGEDWSSDTRGIEDSVSAVEARSAESLPIVGTLAEPDPAGPLGGSSLGAGPPQVLPLVRKLAKDLGVDLSTVRGSGPEGRITRADVEAAAGSRVATVGSSAPASGDERVRMSRIRRTIAQNMTRSWREIPHVTAFDQANVGPLLAARRDLADGREEPLPLEALFIRAVLPALRIHPEFNATLDGEDLILKKRYDVGFAVDASDGLTVAVVKGAEDLDLWALADEVARLAEAVRARTATIQEVTGATFTVSNIGAMGGGFGTSIIPYGTTAILSFGRAHEEPLAREGRVVVGQVMPLSVSYDHRVIDGALGRRFLARVIQSLENPGSLFEPPAG
jgi:pyruvate dehydrogenase E2 component (dihydrolipoamide acetyltransferase)